MRNRLFDGFLDGLGDGCRGCSRLLRRLVSGDDLGLLGSRRRNGAVFVGDFLDRSRLGCIGGSFSRSGCSWRIGRWGQRRRVRKFGGLGRLSS